jgi:hypothetical protein
VRDFHRENVRRRVKACLLRCERDAQMAPLSHGEIVRLNKQAHDLANCAAFMAEYRKWRDPEGWLDRVLAEAEAPMRPGEVVGERCLWAWLDRMAEEKAASRHMVAEGCFL